MKSPNLSIPEQVRRNFVALVSLVIAVSSLSYTSWRHEQTEENHNSRTAAFEALLKLGELQQLVFHRHYDQELDKGNPRTGWAYVLTIQDLSSLLPPPATESASELVETWGDHWQGLGSNQTSADAIIGAIDNTRNNTLVLLRSLK
ncbi:MAG TPA: hypothetical protein ENI05_11830 [Porticoccus sp.]|nr:hypothetical protein [Porticoccus sp.]